MNGRRLSQRLLHRHKRKFATSEIIIHESLPTTTVFSALDSGCTDYVLGWAWQQYLLHRRLWCRRNRDDTNSNDGDCILVFEHKPVYTLGRGANEKHITCFREETDENIDMKLRLARTGRGPGSARLHVDRGILEESMNFITPEMAINQLFSLASRPVIAPNGVPIFRVERGGEVTFHGPGQLVIYPLLDLQREPYRQDLHWLLRMIEEVVIRTLKEYDIEGARDDVNTGVWVGQQKVAAVGVTASRWITTHGFALNVSPDLSFFDTSIIVPCGIDGRGVTSISRVLAERGETTTPSLHEVAEKVLENMKNVFSIKSLRRNPLSNHNAY